MHYNSIELRSTYILILHTRVYINLKIVIIGVII